MNLQDVTTIVVAVLPVIIGLVEFTKKFGLEGKQLMAVSFLLGAVLSGLGYAYIQFPDSQPWITLFMVVVIGGLAANGLYDLYNSRFPKNK